MHLPLVSQTIYNLSHLWHSQRQHFTFCDLTELEDPMTMNSCLLAGPELSLEFLSCGIVPQSAFMAIIPVLSLESDLWNWVSAPSLHLPWQASNKCLSPKNCWYALVSILNYLCFFHAPVATFPSWGSEAIPIPVLGISTVWKLFLLHSFPPQSTGFIWLFISLSLSF